LKAIVYPQNSMLICWFVALMIENVTPDPRWRCAALIVDALPSVTFVLGTVAVAPMLVQYGAMALMLQTFAPAGHVTVCAVLATSAYEFTTFENCGVSVGMYPDSGTM